MTFQPIEHDDLSRLPPALQDLVDRLRDQDVTVRLVRQHRPKPPPTPTPAMTWPIELGAIVTPDDEFFAGPTSMDILGCYVRDEPDRDLPVGIHLFADIIAEATAKHAMPPDLLPWQVLWHEYTHAAIDLSATSLPAPPAALQPIRLDEPLCEAASLWALQQGEHPYVPLSGPRHAESWRIEKWRMHHPLLPYSHVVRTMPAFEAAGMNLAQQAAIAFLQLAPAAIDGRATAKPKRAGAQVIRDSVDFLAGKMPPGAALEFVEALAARAALRTRQRNWRDIVVYVWNGGIRWPRA